MKFKEKVRKYSVPAREIEVTWYVYSVHILPVIGPIPLTGVVPRNCQEAFKALKLTEL
jgi:hypothetical protein